MKVCWFNGTVKWCEIDAKHALPVGDDGLRWYCTPCYDFMCEKLKAWARGENTEARQLKARAYQRRHPEV